MRVLMPIEEEREWKTIGAALVQLKLLARPMGSSRAMNTHWRSPTMDRNGLPLVSWLYAQSLTGSSPEKASRKWLSILNLEQLEVGSSHLPWSNFSLKREPSSTLSSLQYVWIGEFIPYNGVLICNVLKTYTHSKRKKNYWQVFTLRLYQLSKLMW